MFSLAIRTIQSSRVLLCGKDSGNDKDIVCHIAATSLSIATHLFYTRLYPTPIYFGTIMRCTRGEIRQRMVLAVLRLKFKILKSIQNSMILVIYKWACDYLRTWIQLSKGRKAKTLTQEIHIFPEVLGNKCMWGYVEYFCSMTEFLKNQNSLNLHFCFINIKQKS